MNNGYRYTGFVLLETVHSSSRSHFSYQVRVLGVSFGSVFNWFHISIFLLGVLGILPLDWTKGFSVLSFLFSILIQDPMFGRLEKNFYVLAVCHLQSFRDFTSILIIIIRVKVRKMTD